MDNEIIVMVFMVLMLAIIVLTSKLFVVTNETLASFNLNDKKHKSNMAENTQKNP